MFDWNAAISTVVEISQCSQHTPRAQKSWPNLRIILRTEVLSEGKQP
jgi:hypothetical protein